MVQVLVFSAVAEDLDCLLHLFDGLNIVVLYEGSQVLIQLMAVRRFHYWGTGQSLFNFGQLIQNANYETQLNLDGI